VLTVARVTLGCLLQNCSIEIPRYSAANLRVSACCSLLVGVRGFGCFDATAVSRIDIAMEARGCSNMQMHQQYVDLQDTDVGSAFGTSQIDKRIDKQNRVARHK